MSFKDLPINLKIIGLLALLGLGSGVAALYAAKKMSDIDATYSALLEGQGASSVALPRSRQALTRIEMYIYRNATATSDAANAEAVKGREESEKAFFQLLDQVRKADPDTKKVIDEQQAKVEAALNGACGNAVRLANSATDSTGNAKAAEMMNSECFPKLEEVSEVIRRITDETIEEMRKSSDDATNEANSVRFTLLISIALASIAVFGLAMYLTRRFISAPLAGLMSTMTEIGKGQLNVSIANADRADEVGAMAKTLEDLRRQLVEAEGLRQQQAKAQAQREERQRVVAAAVQKFETVIGKVVGTVSSASGQLEQAAQSLTSTASYTQELSSTVASASEQTSANVQGVAAASEELASTVSEIARQVQESATITNEAVAQAAKTNNDVAQLSDAATRIGDVVSLINNIASQTNLLALNATIEAARAGDAGKGFAVVAQEVKALATQTEKATAEIGSQITSMQAATSDAVAAIQGIAATIRKVNDITGAIAAAVEEQEATTKEITRNVTEAARGTTEVASSIMEVSNGAVSTGSASSQVLSSAKQLSQESNNLNREVNEFLSSIRAA